MLSTANPLIDLQSRLCIVIVIGPTNIISDKKQFVVRIEAFVKRRLGSLLFKTLLQNQKFNRFQNLHQGNNDMSRKCLNY